MTHPPRDATPPRGLSLRVQGALALAAGALAGAGQAPFDAWYVAVPAFAALFALFRASATPRAAAVLGLLAGLAYFAVALRWIVEPFQVEAEVYGWMAPFALAGMAAGLALFWAAGFWAARRIGRLWALVPLWALVEIARGYVLTGFPWALPAYVWADTHVIHLTAWIGSYGLTALTFALAAALADGWSRLGSTALARLILAPGALLAAAALAAPQSPLAPDASPDAPVVRLIQPNAPQTEKWRPENIPLFFRRQVDFTAEGAPPDLVVWPETALPMLLEDAGEAFAIIDEAARGAPVALGIQRREGPRYYNALVMLDGEAGPVAQYDKHHLVPFGEYMPFAALFERFDILGLAARAEAGYSAGPGPAQIAIEGIGRVIPLICYEAVFPQYGRAPGGRPAALLQVTNDAWFGVDSGPYQHFAQARIRAIEQGLPMIRAANTGISAVIDGRGRVVASLPLGQAGYVDAALPAPEPATVYAQIGDIPIALSLIFLTLLGIRSRTRKRA